MSKIFDRFFYHGAPCPIETFDYAFTGQGTDQHGSGFYFTSDKTEASGYCEANAVAKNAGVISVPTLHKVRLKIENPLDANFIGGLTFGQAREIIARAPDIETTMWDWYDLSTMSLDTAIDKAARICAAHDDGPLIKRLNAVTGDFYGEHIGELNKVLKDVLGYDGLILRENKRILAVAWFPEQVEIVQRITYRKLELAEEGPTP